MEQRRLEQLAEELAQLAAAGDPAAMSARVSEEAAAQRLAPWALTNLIAREWDRLGIVRVPAGFQVRIA